MNIVYVYVIMIETTEDRSAGVLLPTLYSHSHSSALCSHRRQPTQQRYDSLSDI